MKNNINDFPIRKIIICRGIPGSGKTFFAKNYTLKDPEHIIRINNDDIRNMLGKYWVPSREKVVKSIYDITLMSSMIDGYNIVIDNMNLNSKTCEEIEDIVKHFNKDDSYNFKYEIEYKDFFIPLEECIERDSKRPNPIGEKVIRDTYEKYKDIIEHE